MLSETDVVVHKLAEAFDALGILYMVGGSIASSLFGMPRFTRDVDISVRIEESVAADALVRLLEQDFYIDADLIQAAVAHRSSFNVIYLPTMLKADIFVPEDSAWRREEWQRRRHEQVGVGPESRPVYFASPEDMVLQKLLWYRETGERSDRQWGDVQGILKVQRKVLDRAYMRQWASQIAIADLLELALAEAGDAT